MTIHSIVFGRLYMFCEPHVQPHLRQEAREYFKVPEVLTCQHLPTILVVASPLDRGDDMNGMETNHRNPPARRGAVIELSMDDYDLDDLAGEIARTLEACQTLTDEPHGTDRTDDIPQAR